MEFSKEEALKSIEIFNLTDLLDSLENYKDEMTVSQVVRFFERRGIALTKTMLQNYVRVGVLSPLSERRYYLRKHLVQIFLVQQLKSLYSLEELALLFSRIDDEGYKNFAAVLSACEEKLLEATNVLLNYSNKIKSNEINSEKVDSASLALDLMLLSAVIKTAALKALDASPPQQKF